MPDPLFDEDSSEYGRPETGAWEEPCDCACHLPGWQVPPEGDDCCECRQSCHFCGERYDPQHPNAGDGWAEMADPSNPVHLFADGPDEPVSVMCHYSCGRQRGWEVA